MSFEARTSSSEIWKKLVESMKELVSEVNFDLTPNGISIQSMDAAHVALVSMQMQKQGFDMFHMERNSVLGVNMKHFSSILKTIESKDSLTLKHNYEESNLTLVAEQITGTKDNNKAANPNARKSEFNLKLMEIDTEQMTIPEIEYKASITMSSNEFAKICRDMAVFGDTITVGVSHDGVRFFADGDLGSGNTMFRIPVESMKNQVKPEVAGEEDNKQEQQESASAAVKPEVKSEVKEEVKSEEAPAVKTEEVPRFDDDESFAAIGLRKQKGENAAPRSSNKKNQDGAAEDGDAPAEVKMAAEMQEEVELSFALRYMTLFSKASSLSNKVRLHLTQEQPCMVEFIIDNLGYLRFFLAPKVEAAD